MKPSKVLRQIQKVLRQIQKKSMKRVSRVLQRVERRGHTSVPFWFVDDCWLLLVSTRALRAIALAEKREVV